MVGKSFILVSFSFERVSSTAVMDQRVGTSFLFFLRPRRPAERILTSCSVSVCFWSSMSASFDFISVSEA